MEDSWYKFSCIQLEWLNPEIHLDVKRYIRDLVRRSKEINADAIAFVVECGDRLLYPGKLAPIDEHINGEDFLGMLEKEVHDNNLKFIAAFFGLQGRTWLSKEHPDWTQKDKEGKTKEWYNFTLLCPNSPFGDYYPELIEEVLSRYSIDGIYIEGVYIPPGFCYCNSCQEMFLLTYGKQLPVEEPLKDREYNEFRQHSITNFYRKINKKVKEISPKTIIFGCGYYPTSVNLYDFSRYVDVVVSEEQWGYTAGYNPAKVPLWEVGLRIKLIRSESRKPVKGTLFVAKHVDYEYSSRSPSHLKLTTMEIVSAGGSPQVHTQNAFEVDDSLIPVLRELFDNVKSLKTYLTMAKPFTKVAILNWMDPLDYRRMAEDIFYYADKGVKGFYKALLEKHIQAEFITSKDILDGELDNYKVLIMIDSLYIDKEVIEKIREFLYNGGGLVATFRSGWYSKDGKKFNKPILVDILGVENYYSIVKRPNSIQSVIPFCHTYYKINSSDPLWRGLKGKVLSFQGSYIEIEASKDVEKMAYVLNFDYTKLHSNHWLKSGYPGREISPMIISRTIGNGKSIYCSADLEVYSLEYGDQETIEVLGNLVKYAGGEDIELVKIEAPGTVEINSYTFEDVLIIFLINHTTNQLTPDKVVRYIIPIKDIKIEIKWSKIPRSVFCLPKDNLETKMEKDRIVLSIPNLEEYKILILR